MPDDALTRARPILFGKLPHHGDFIARNLDAAAREAWDLWASDGLQRARHSLGDGFETVHDSIPPWRFIDGPGAFGSGWRAGVMAPSIDAASRRFMIVLAAEGLSADEAGASGESIAEAMEALVYRAFEADWDADTLIEAARAPLATLAQGGGESPRPRCWTLGDYDHLERWLEGPLDGAFERIMMSAADGPGMAP
jgi:type VI secretion system ImpM family protein